MRLFFREMARHWRFGVQFVVVLSLGLTGFLLVEALRASVAHSLQQQSRAMLAGDLSLSKRQPFTTEEEARLREVLQEFSVAHSRAVEFFSMVAKGAEARLVLVKAIDEKYPLVGTVRTEPPHQVRQLGAQIEPGFAIASPEILDQLSVGKNDKLRIGSHDFSLSGSLVEDPTQSFRAFALGGRVYVPLRLLYETKLLQPGSTATYSYLMTTANEAAAETLKKHLEKLFPDPEVQISTAKEAGESATRALSYMGDFLGLVSLIALLLSSLGAAYLYRSHIESRRQEIAIYRALGFPLRTLQWQSAAQTIFLALVALLPASLFALGLLPLLEWMIASWSKIKLELILYPSAFLPLLLLCVGGAPLVLLPELIVLKSFTPLDLFREQAREGRKRPVAHYVPALFLFVGMAPVVARSFKNAGIFLGILAVLLLLLFFVLRLFAAVLPRIRSHTWTFRHAFLFLSRKRRSTATVFLTLSLGSLLVHLLPQLEASLRAELEAPTTLPALFLFDIQEEQKSALERALAGATQKPIVLSPLVRARISAINGKPFERVVESSAFKTREEEQESRFRNRGVNLSFRGSLQESETLVSGLPFADAWKAETGRIPEVSVETRFADRLGLSVGDLVKFDVQGVSVEGKIVNKRRVRWTSFQPNFFLLFQNGVLDDAPKTYLASLSAVPPAEKRRIQSLLAKNFPNVSVIDVASTIERMLELLSRMRLALLLLAGLALTAGLSVLVSVLRLEAQERASSLILFRILGASKLDLQRLLLIESLVVSSLAVLLGAAGSVLFTYGLSRFVFDGAFRIGFTPLVGLSVFLLLVSVSVSRLAARSLVGREPLEILREGRR